MKIDQLVQALERAELSTCQIRLAADIGRKPMRAKLAWYESQLIQLGAEIRTALDQAKEGTT
jgi:hypothetical protein